MPPPAPPVVSTSPVDRYVASLRRPRIVYAIVLAVVVLVFGTIFVTVWARGSAAHATLHTVPSAPAGVPLAAAAATQTVAWRTGERAAEGTPQWLGTVITWSAHTLGGRNARTGERTWSYTRSDRTVCAAGQVNGVAIALYERTGSCDEVDAFDAGTGHRLWARTLDENGQPIDGRPTVSFDSSALLVYSLHSLYAIGVGNGVDVLTFTRPGCTIERAVTGTAGVLISLECGASVDCTGMKFCGRGTQLALDKTADRAQNAPDDNKDQLAWNLIGYTGVPASADTLVSAVQPGSNVLDVLSAANGKVRHRVQLAPAPGSLTRLTATATDSAELIWADGHVYTLPGGGASVSWVASSAVPPTVADDQSNSVPVLAQARVTVPAAGGATTINPETGAVEGHTKLSGAASGAIVWPLGAGFLVASATGTVVYR